MTQISPHVKWVLSGHQSCHPGFKVSSAIRDWVNIFECHTVRVGVMTGG